MSRRLHVVTNSEIEDFRKCRTLWGFRYPERLRPIHEKQELNYGKLWHLGADAGWRRAWESLDYTLTQRQERARFGAIKAICDAHMAHRAWLENPELAPFEVPQQREEAIAALDEMAHTASWAVCYYFERRQEDLGFVPLVIEAPFDVPIPTRGGQGGMLRQNGKMDLVLWDEQASQVLLDEHKTTGYAVQTFEGRLALLTQPTGYLRALQVELERASTQGWRRDFWSHTTPAVRGLMEQCSPAIWRSATGVIRFNVSRRAQPKRPDLNLLRAAQKFRAVNPALDALMAAQEKDEKPRGEVSSADIDTLPEVYETALEVQERARGLPITDKQRARLAALRGKANPFFEQYEFYRGPAELERWRAEQWVEARQMREAERNPLLRTRNPNACTGPGSPKCLYAALCVAPDDPVARADFRVAAERHEELSHGDGGFGIHGEASAPFGGAPTDPF